MYYLPVSLSVFLSVSRNICLLVCLQRGLYRVPGGERLVKDLRDRFLQGKFPLMLSKVNDVHVLCGFLKDFLRKLKEPLITFRLHRTFMEVSGMNTKHCQNPHQTL